MAETAIGVIGFARQHKQVAFHSGCDCDLETDWEDGVGWEFGHEVQPHPKQPAENVMIVFEIVRWIEL